MGRLRLYASVWSNSPEQHGRTNYFWFLHTIKYPPHSLVFTMFVLYATSSLVQAHHDICEIMNSQGNRVNLCGKSNNHLNISKYDDLTQNCKLINSKLQYCKRCLTRFERLKPFNLFFLVKNQPIQSKIDPQLYPFASAKFPHPQTAYNPRKCGPCHLLARPNRADNEYKSNKESQIRRT